MSLPSNWSLFAFAKTSKADSVSRLNIFSEIGRVYVPALLANAEAIDKGETQVDTEIDGRPWVQKPFPYQAKCLRWIRQEFTQLDEMQRKRLLEFLDGTGCELLLDREQK